MSKLVKLIDENKMNYEKLYKDAFERAREELGSGCFNRGTIEYIFPELKESEDEKMIRIIIKTLQDINKKYNTMMGDILLEDCIAWLEKQDNTNIEQVFRPLAGCCIDAAARQAVEQQKQGKNVVLAFNGFYIPVKNNTADAIVNEYYSWIEKQRKNNMSISEATKKKLEDNLNKALEKETPESWNKFFEKQGEQKETLCDRCKREQPSHSCQDITELGRCAVEHERKSANKVEPKFEVKKGKWYVCTDTFVLKGKIIAIKGQIYQSKQEDNTITCEDNCLFVDRHDGKASDYFRYWTIQDAKDGDVLASNGSIILFKEISNSARKDYKYIQSHCLVLAHSSDFYTGGSYNLDDRFHPATKEQRDLLFQKIKEAGYELNAEKKEL